MAHGEVIVRVQLLLGRDVEGVSSDVVTPCCSEMGSWEDWALFWFEDPWGDLNAWFQVLQIHVYFITEYVHSKTVRSCFADAASCCTVVIEDGIYRSIFTFGTLCGVTVRGN